MSDNLNETNNEINESNQSETVENKPETVEEQHTEATQQAANVDAKESSEQAKAETVNQTVITTPNKKQNIIGLQYCVALVVLGYIQHKVEILVKQ